MITEAVKKMIKKSSLNCDMGFIRNIVLDEKDGVLSFLKNGTDSVTYDGIEFYEYCLELLIDAMNLYRRNISHANLQKLLYSSFVKLIHGICITYDIEGENEYLKWLDDLYAEEHSIKLVKALHKREGITNKELQSLLGVKYKTIQNDLRRLSPDLCESENAKFLLEPVTIAGVPAKVKISVDEKARGKKYYHTPNTMHPINMQLSMMQVGALLEALYLKSDTEYDSTIISELAIDIWLQLSDYAKGRLIEIYGKRDEDFRFFLEGMRLECEEHPERIVARQFRTDREVAAESYIRDKLLYACKSNRPSTVCYIDDCLDVTIENVIVSLVENDRDTFLLRRRNGENIKVQVDNVKEVK